METMVVVLFAVVVLAVLALIRLVGLLFKDDRHRSEGGAVDNVAELDLPGARGYKKIGFDYDFDWLKL